MDYIAYVGPMFARKTERQLEEARYAHHAGWKTQFLVPLKDDRHGVGVVQSHAGRELGGLSRVSVHVVQGVWDLDLTIDSDTQCVLVDEAHLLLQRSSPCLGKVLHSYAARGVHVRVAGLDLDWRAEPIDTLAEVMAYASNIVKLYAACACGERATLTWFDPAARAGGTRVVGGAELYTAKCARCYYAAEAALHATPP